MWYMFDKPTRWKKKDSKFDCYKKYDKTKYENRLLRLKVYFHKREASKIKI